MRNLTAAIMASRTKTAKTMSWVMANGGSVCVGASAFNAGTFSKALHHADEDIQV